MPMSVSCTCIFFWKETFWVPRLCPTLPKSSLDTLHPTKRKKMKQKKVLCTGGSGSVCQIQNNHPGSHLKQWGLVKHNLWRREKIIFYVLTLLTRPQFYSLLSLSTDIAPLLNKSPNKSVTGYFVWYCSQASDHLEKSTVYSTKFFSVSISNTQGHLNTFGTRHIIPASITPAAQVECFSSFVTNVPTPGPRISQLRDASLIRQGTP